MSYKFLANGSDGVEGEIYPSIVASQANGIDYTVNITQDFGSPYTFDNVIALLDNATDYDSVTFKINSGGGDLFSLIALQNALRETRAQFHMVLLGQASSAGGALFLTEGAGSYNIGNSTMLMIHAVQSGSGYGSTNEIKVRGDVNHELNKRFVAGSYKDFLTPEEIDDVINNSREIYMFEEEIIDRLGKRIELRKTQQMEALSESDDEELSFDGITDQELKDERQAITLEIRRRSSADKKAKVST